MSLRSLSFALLLSAIFAPPALAQAITVRPGDTLWDLARRHGTTIEALRQANGLSSDVLRPGMELILPTGSNPTPKTYIVAEGDTLYDIALAFDLSVDDVIAFNDLDGTVIQPGQLLQLEPPDVPAPQLVVTVVVGDTLWALAKEHGTSVEAIQAANGLTKNSLLRPGDSLTIPGRYADVAPPAPQPVVITVAPGDTLWEIARRYNTTVTALSAANGIPDTSLIRPGDALTIPGVLTSISTDKGGSVAPTVVVEPGDSLWEIAQRYNTTVAVLMAENGLKSSTLAVGQELRIVPGSDLVRAGPAPSPTPGVAGTLIWPLSGVITSRFGYRRLRIGGTNLHFGLDIDGETGDPIRAATAGTVSFSGNRGGYGLLVVVTNGDTEYYYAHTSELLVQTGETVTVGQVIARVGSTGRSTGSHLHFEIRVNGTPVDPLPLLEASAQR